MLTHPTLRLHVLNSTFIKGVHHWPFWELRTTVRMSGVGNGSGWITIEIAIERSKLA